MGKIKKITTIVEDEVVYMVNPNVEYVSLVKHGANRAPFKVLKTDKEKEDLNMNKVVQSVLVRNDIPDDVLVKALEGIDKRSKQDFTTFTAFPQVALSKVDSNSIIVQKHEEVDGIYFVLGDLAEGQNDSGTLQVNVKEAVDYATLDNLYTELYAMADVVGGAMRQQNADGAFRKDTILKAIENFRAFAEVVLENLTPAKLEKGVNPEDHPELVVDILHAVKEATAEEKAAAEAAAKAEAEAKAKEEAEAAAASSSEEENPMDNLITSFNDSLNSFGDKLIGALQEVGKGVKENSDKVSQTVEKITTDLAALQNTVVSTKSEPDEHNKDKDKKEENVFKGAIFNLSR